MPFGQATTSREARDEAIRQIPFDQMDQVAQQKLARVIAKPTMYRRLPVRVIEGDPEMYLFLVRHPEVVVNIWDLMGVTNVKTQRTGPFTLRAQDGAGTTTDVELVYGSNHQHVVYAEGYYEGPLSGKRLTGRCVLLLTSGYQQNERQVAQITNQLDVFLQLDNVGADLLAKTLQPLVGRTADHNFIESAGFVGQLCQAAETNSHGLQRLADKLTSLDPATRTQFSGLATAVGERAIMRRDALERTPAELIAIGSQPAVPGEPLPQPASLRIGSDGPLVLRRQGPDLRR
ncbi:MAG: hypothetical protein J5I93_00570 [Pirellulaceae bacterium]|nr:hypothetical protein [Pirellulaceae bacterium]